MNKKPVEKPDYRDLADRVSKIIGKRVPISNVRLVDTGYFTSKKIMDALNKIRGITNAQYMS